MPPLELDRAGLLTMASLFDQLDLSGRTSRPVPPRIVVEAEVRCWLLAHGVADVHDLDVMTDAVLATGG